MISSVKSLLSGAVGIGLCVVAGSAALADDPCTVSATIQCYSFTDPGSISVSTPFGSVEVDQTLNGSNQVVSEKFTVSVSPNFDITAGNAHEAFSFAMGPSPGTLANEGTMSMLVQNGGTGTLSFGSQGGSPFQNSPFGDFNYSLLCSPNGGSQNCGQGFSFVFTFTTLGTGELIPATNTHNGNTIWFAADICVPAVAPATGCSATGAAGATLVPAPIVGAGIPGLLAACAGLLALGRRRRQKMA
jgi:hypothetical protein